MAEAEEQEPKMSVIAETDNYLAIRAEEPDGETTYHLELNNFTIHFFQEEWVELLSENLEPVAAEVAEAGDYVAWRDEGADGKVIIHLEINNATLHFYEDEWDELLALIREIKS